MATILVIYHSQQFGNTGLLAEALAQGARGEGAEVALFNTNEHRVTLDEFLIADAVALGSPDYFSYVAGTIKTFFDDIYQWEKAGETVKGKQAGRLIRDSWFFHLDIKGVPKGLQALILDILSYVTLHLSI